MSGNGNGNGHRSLTEIEHDIEQTRERLAETAAGLADKADVAGRVRRRAAEAREHLGETVHHVADNAPQAARENPLPTAAIGAFAGGLLIGWLLHARRG